MSTTSFRSIRTIFVGDSIITVPGRRGMTEEAADVVDQACRTLRLLTRVISRPMAWIWEDASGSRRRSGRKRADRGINSR